MIDKQIEVDMGIVHERALVRAKNAAIEEITIRYMDGGISLVDVVNMMHDIDNDPQLHISAYDYYPEVITDILFRGDSGCGCVDAPKNLHRAYPD